jgi:hypothetical protein
MSLSADSIRSANQRSWWGDSVALKEVTPFGDHNIVWMVQEDVGLHGVLLLDPDNIILKGMWNKNANILYYHLEGRVEGRIGDKGNTLNVNEVVNTIDQWIF